MMSRAEGAARCRQVESVERTLFMAFIKGNRGEIRAHVFRVEWIEGWWIIDETNVYIYNTREHALQDFSLAG